MTATPDRIGELHRLAWEDYAKGNAQRARAEEPPARPLGMPDPRELDAAIRVGRKMLAAYGRVDGCDVFAYARAHGGLSEALRILLRALGAELDVEPPAAVPLENRCPAAHPEDPTSCVGPVVVTVLDGDNAGADGCELHAVRLLASLIGGRPVAKPDAPEGIALRIFHEASRTRPFAWREGL
ncbi:hypothetical protein [Streptomyces longwoodensis]|uniref:hypothetical protein n=1 Tax=Streptomyces longwoodensis TaxID=68231 RepID=UPI0033E60588